jgi:arylsulfatase A-like enzyme
VVAVVAAAFVVRALALVAADDAQLVLDEQHYLQRAEALLDGQGFLGSYQSWVRHEGRPIELPQYPGAWQPPGQTLFLASAMAVFGRNVTAARFAQVVLGTLGVWLVWLLGRAWLDERHGLVAAWICALYPNLVAFTHYLWSETLFIALFLAALVLLTRRRAAPTAVEAMAGGALLGLAALTRASALYFLPLLLLWMVWAWPAERRRVLGRTALAAGAALLMILPWTVRNTALHGGFVAIETNAPYNLWRGNGPDAFAGRGSDAVDSYAWPFQGIPIAPVGNRTARRLVEEARRDLGSAAPGDLEIAGYARASALDAIREAPGRFVARIPIRLEDLWNPTSFLLRHFRLGAYGPVPTFVVALVSAAAVLGYLALMGLAAAGLWRLRRQPEAWLVLGWALFLSAVSAVSFGLTRFRLPFVPLAAIAAAPALLALLGRLRGSRAGAVALATLALPALLACGSDRPTASGVAGPNILWVVWDTVRSDHLGVYGYERPTTPRLDAWADGARVFEDVVSPAGYTLPAHASMFTGLLPSEHCTHNDQRILNDRHETIAERLHEAGYRTFLFSANPQISNAPNRNFAQGFERHLHPWSPSYQERARAIVEAKLPPEDRSSELPARMAEADGGGRELTTWNIKAAGELAQEALLAWLDEGEPERPWFAFLNYMEAHRPLIPAREYRAHFMSETDVARSYEVDRSWLPIWEYVFGLRDYSEAELELTRATYDATIRELDDLFAMLLAALRQRGNLDDTVVILTSDHGEHLGEHHMLDHQYSLYEPVLRVPLLIHAPGRIEPGRDPRPVSTVDLFATVLALAELPNEDGSPLARSLLAPDGERARLAEDPARSEVGMAMVVAAHPDFDPSPWRQSRRALYAGRYKYMQSSDGRKALYDLQADPAESDSRLAREPAARRRLEAALSHTESRLERCDPAARAESPPLTLEQCEMLKGLGYVDDCEQAKP